MTQSGWTEREDHKEFERVLNHLNELKLDPYGDGPHIHFVDPAQEEQVRAAMRARKFYAETEKTILYKGRRP